MTNERHEHNSTDHQPAPTPRSPDDGSESATFGRRGFLQKTAVAGVAAMIGLPSATDSASAVVREISVEGHQTGRHHYTIRSKNLKFFRQPGSDEAEDRIPPGESEVHGTLLNRSTDNYVYDISSTSSPSMFTMFSANGNVSFDFDPPIPDSPSPAGGGIIVNGFRPPEDLEGRNYYSIAGNYMEIKRGPEAEGPESTSEGADEIRSYPDKDNRPAVVHGVVLEADDDNYTYTRRSTSGFTDIIVNGNVGIGFDPGLLL